MAQYNSFILCFLVCPDPVDKYLEETSVRYVSPRGGAESRESIPHRRAGGCANLHNTKFMLILLNNQNVTCLQYLFCSSLGPQPVICCSPSGPQVGPSRTKPAPPGPSRKRKRTHTTGDCREKQTCGKARIIHLI